MHLRRLGAGLAAAVSSLAILLAPANAGGLEASDEPFFGSASLGAMAIVTPKYEGSSDYRVWGVPIIAPGFGSGESRVHVKDFDDIRFRLFDYHGFEAGPLAGWRLGRDEDDGSRLRGLGDVDGGLVIGGYLAYRMGFLKPFVSYHHQVTGDDTSGVLRLGADAYLTVRPGFEIVGTIGTSYADDDYMHAFFSVTPAQSLASVAGLGVYDADAGFKDVFVGATAKIALSDLWTLHLTTRYTHLIGDAADSPLVESEHQWTGGVGVSYRFDLR